MKNILDKFFEKEPKPKPVLPGTLLVLTIEYPEHYPCDFKEYVMYVETKRKEYKVYTHWFIKANGELDYIEDTEKQFFVEDCYWLERADK